MPPWPEPKFKLGQNGKRSLKFSPRGSFFPGMRCSLNVPIHTECLSATDQEGYCNFCLIGHTSCISHLSISKFGKYLLVSADTINPFEYDHPILQDCHIQQSDITLLRAPMRYWMPWFRTRRLECLGIYGLYLQIKVWNVETKVYVHTILITAAGLFGPSSSLRAMKKTTSASF